jgi:hypothetical protein
MIEASPTVLNFVWTASFTVMTAYYIYLILLLVACLLGFWCRKSDHTLKIIMWLLFALVVTEAIVYVMAITMKLKPQFFLLYHIHVPIEYLFVSLYFSKHIAWARINTAFYLLAGMVVLVDIYLSLIAGDVFSYPGKNLNVSGFLIIAWSATALFSIRPEIDRSIFSFPVFWIGIGFLIYYSGSFFHNFIYGLLIKSDSGLAAKLNAIINKGVNDVLYICISIAFICSHRLKKYT